MMKKTHGPWRIHSSVPIYKNPWMRVREDKVTRPDGTAGIHGVVTIIDGVLVLPVDNQMNVHLVDEFKYALGRRSLETVGGGIDAGESARTAAKRELEEELGIKAKKWTSFGRIDPLTTVVYAPIAMFLAQELTCTNNTNHEATETIASVCMPLKEAVEKVLQGSITHGPSCIALLKASIKLL